MEKSFGPKKAKAVNIPTSVFVLAPKYRNCSELVRRISLSKENMCLAKNLIIICECAVVNIRKHEGRMLD